MVLILDRLGILLLPLLICLSKGLSLIGLKVNFSTLLCLIEFQFFLLFLFSYDCWYVFENISTSVFFSLEVACLINELDLHICPAVGVWPCNYIKRQVQNKTKKLIFKLISNPGFVLFSHGCDLMVLNLV